MCACSSHAESTNINLRSFYNLLKYRFFTKKFLAVVLVISALLVVSYSKYSFPFVNKYDFNNFTHKLKILSHNNKIADFCVAIADDDYKRAKGLMYYQILPKKLGMLFLFEKQQNNYYLPISMWMKNTIVNLDMIFINEDNLIIGLHHQAEAGSLKIIKAPFGTAKVLELIGGTIKNNDIKINDIIILEDPNSANDCRKNQF